MIQTDTNAIILIEIALIVIAMFSAYKDFTAKFVKQGYEGEVIRGDKSMSAVYTVYGAAIASLLVLAGSTPSLDGNKVLFITINFFLISYIFLFNSWFRNNVFFKLLNRARKD